MRGCTYREPSRRHCSYGEYAGPRVASAGLASEGSGSRDEVGVRRYRGKTINRMRHSKTTRSTVRFALPILFPGLVIAMVVGNQLWRVGPFYIGQCISWLVDMTAVVGMIAFYRRHVWPAALVLVLFCSRALGQGWNGVSVADYVYVATLNAIFCALGAAVA